MKVLIVDDSAVIRSILKHIFKTQENNSITIVGNGKTGQDAITLNRELKPDIIIMDVNMPIMDGLEATRIIMKESPVPILIFSSSIDKEISFNALKYGALDVMHKPEMSEINDPIFYKNFIDKLFKLSKVKLTQPSKESYDNLQKEVGVKETQYKVVVMGASTGGPNAVSEILKRLPQNFPLGIILVQHLQEGFDENYANWLNSETNFKVKLAHNKNRVIAGEVLIAPVEKHLVFSDENHVCFDNSPRVLNQKPSVDVLFKSAANLFRKNVIGILLTGMGADGAQGCLEIKQNGGITLVQDQKSSIIFGMPKAAIQKGGASQVLSLKNIPIHLIKLLKNHKKK